MSRSASDAAVARPATTVLPTRVALHAPRIGAHEVAFSFDVEPATALYRRTAFTLRFPEAVDVATVPDALWWRIAFLCLHPQWALLRPCTVHVPVALPAGERAFWTRLIEAVATTLDAYRTPETRALLPPVAIVDDGPPLAPFRPLPDRGRCATAFSGGKDSLVQTGLLAELTEHPILVATTSPMPPLSDHLTARRRHVLAQVARRRDVTLVEVESDLRAAWDNDFPSRQGYQIAVNEISDTLLYSASLIATAAALGATHCFLASEAEVQENVERDGAVVQHPHCMYSTVTQRALQALFRPLGLRYGSLTSPLHAGQVQQLLWKRYGDLADLQYSCWRVGPNQRTCSTCGECFRMALGVLALGGSPEAAGIDLVRLLKAMRDWTPRLLPPGTTSATPGERVGDGLRRQIVHSIQTTRVRRVAGAIARRPWRLLDPRARSAIRAYAALRRRVAVEGPVGPCGYRPRFLRIVDEQLRAQLGEIFERHFAVEDEAAYAGILARGDALVRWIVEPLGGEA